MHNYNIPNFAIKTIVHRHYWCENCTMKRFYNSLVALFFLIIPFAAPAEKRISLLTCSAGDDVYTLYGHTAIRVTDDVTGEDIVYNYGIFNFEEPNFVWRFTLGETDYMLAATTYNRFCRVYSAEQRGVVEQVLNLTPQQSERLAYLLAVNALPKNRVYRYNFLFSNCTTKSRDKILEALGDGCTLNYGTVDVKDGEVDYVEPFPDDASYRDILHYYSGKSQWYTFGTDMLLGIDADDEAGVAGRQFAPELLMRDFASAEIVAPDGSRRPLVKETNVLLPVVAKSEERNNLTPFNVALLMLIFTFIVMHFERCSKKVYLWWDAIILLLQGVAGLLIAFMVHFSSHPTVDANWLLLWVNPLAIAMIPILFYSTIKGHHPRVMWVQLVMTSAFLLLSPFLPQSFPAPVYIFALMYLVRALFLINRKKICELDI